MTTQREKALANAIERLSGRDLSRFVDAIAWRTGNAYNLNTTERYFLMREIIDYAKNNGGEADA